MPSFRRSTRTCIAAGLGLALTLGGAATAVAGQANGVVADARATPVTITSSTDVRENQAFDIVGTAHPDLDVRIYGVPGIFGGSATVRSDAAGNFRYRVTHGFAAGVHSMSFFTNGASKVVEFRSSDADGVVPEIDALVLTSAATYTVGERATVTGTATPGATIRVEGLGRGVDETTADAEGVWSVTTAEVVVGLSHTVTVSQFHALGHSTVTATFVAVDGNGDPETFNPLAVTSDPTFVFGKRAELSGTATPGARVSVRFPQEIQHATVGADGHWSVTSGSVLHSDSVPVSLDQLSDRGTDSLQVTLSGLGEDGEPATLAPLAITSPLTFTKGRTVEITGTATPGATIEVELGEENPDWANVGEDGTWRFESRWTSFDDVLTVLATQHSTLGSDRVELTLTAGEAQVLDPITITSGDSFTRNEPVTIAGTATPGSDVWVSGFGGQHRAASDASGKWTFTTSGPVDRDVIDGVITQYGPGVSDELAYRLTAGVDGGEGPGDGGEGPDDGDGGYSPVWLESAPEFEPGGPLELRGYGTPGRTITITGIGDQTVTAVPGADRRWSVTVNDVPDTDRLTVSFAQRSHGDQIERQDVPFWKIGTRTSLAITSGSSFVQGERLTVTGTADPGEQVRVAGVEQDELVATADADGKWSVTTSDPADRPVYVVRLTGDDRVVNAGLWAAEGR